MKAKQSRSRIVYAALATAFLISSSLCADEAGLKALLAGVSEIRAPGIPGSLCVFGKDAFAVVAGGVGKAQAPVVAATRMGRGRVVAFGHDGYLSPDSMADEGTARLFKNAIHWAAREAKPRIALHNLDDFAKALRKAGYAAQSLTGANWTGKLAASNILILDPASAPDDIAAVADFVRKGGGLIAANTGWGWLQLNPGKTTADHPGNKLLAGAGIVWTDAMLDRTSKNGFTATQVPSDLVHVTRAFDAIEAHVRGETKLDKDGLEQAAASITQAARVLPADDTLLMPRLRELRKQHASEAIPTADKPLSNEQPLGRIALTLELQELRNTPPEQVRAHPAAASFPGPVPADAPRVTRAVTVDTKVPAWHSTGLYAAPGELIRVAIPPAAANKGLHVHIGCHSDALWHLASWKRAPEVCVNAPLSKPVTSIASAFGGLIYIDVPEGCKLGPVDAEISGVVEAPRFILGRTDPAQWRAGIRSLPGPWAELETRKIILSLPAQFVRTLEDPVPLMEYWDHVLDSCAELAGRPQERERPERYVADVQISAGYMHSGYPIMTWLDVAPTVVDLPKLMKGSWGHFHEMGHNHQSGDWTFDGTGEVTENLFSLYCMDKVCGIVSGGHGAVSPQERAKRMKAYFAAPDFAKWKSDPFLALYMYMQLEEAFGWDTYKRVFAEYRDLPDAQRPKTDDEKRDQWMVRFSRAVGRNLGPFFEAWRVPTSEQARASVKDLPIWMPEDFPPKP